MSEPELLAADMRSRAGHYEVLGETYAKFEFFEKGWNPYSRFLDVDKVDLILRRRTATGRLYREVQVKFGKLYPVGPAWERQHFDFTSWRFFREDEFAAQIDQTDFFIAYVLSRDPTPDKPAYQVTSSFSRFVISLRSSVAESRAKASGKSTCQD